MGHLDFCFLYNRLPRHIRSASPQPLKRPHPKDTKPKVAEDHLNGANCNRDEHTSSRVHFPIQPQAVMIENPRTHDRLHQIIGKCHPSNSGEGLEHCSHTCFMIKIDNRCDIEKHQERRANQQEYFLICYSVQHLGADADDKPGHPHSFQSFAILSRIVQVP